MRRYVLLDDLKMIHTRDADDALGVAEKQWEQLLHAFNVDASRLSGIDNVVLDGMGGSSLPAVYLKSWPGVNKPFEIVRDYDIPSYVGSNTLFISSSYSGNTEETLSALEKAEGKGAQIVVISAGGKLKQIAEEKGYPLFVIPTGIQPRMCAFYFIRALLELMEPLGIVNEGSIGQLEEAGNWLKEQLSGFRPDVATKDNKAKQLALELIGKSVVVYAGPKLFPAANKFKIGLNENAKNVAWVNQYSEFNHNEFIGWSSHPEQKPYAVVEIRSSLENDRIQKRFVISEQLLSGKRPSPEVINPEGDNLVKQLVWASNYVDFVSIYVALLNGINPTPVALVEKLKQLLDQ